MRTNPEIDNHEMAEVVAARKRRNQQPLEALAKANALRMAQVGLKREVATGKVSVAQALRDPRICGPTTALDVLSWQRGWGVQRAGRVLLSADVLRTRPARALTDREVAAISAILAERKAAAQLKRPD